MPTPDGPDYGHGEDWQFIDNIQTATLTFGKDRDLPSGVAREDIEDIACLEGNPTGSLIAAAEMASVSNVSKLFTLWAKTILQGETYIAPLEGDILTVNSKKWLIVSVVDTVFDTQFKCFCKRLSPV